MNNFFRRIGETFFYWATPLFVVLVAVFFSWGLPHIMIKYDNEGTGSFSNHLVWNVKGECFFVGSNSSNYYRMTRLKDCDKNDYTN